LECHPTYRFLLYTYIYPDESHTVLHGRPIPLQGKYYASINVYFEPLGYSTQHFHPKDSNDNHQCNSLQTRFHELEKTSRPEIRTIDTLPYYIPINKQNAWRQNYIFEPFHIPDLATNVISSSHHNDKTSPQKPPTAWTAAAAGDLKTLQEIVAKDPSSVTKADMNGWYPIHEAARSGETEVIRYLVENGADVNARTNHGKGGTALFWVEQSHDPKHPAVTYLQSKGAKSIAPYAKVDNDQDVVVDDEDEAKDDDEKEEDDVEDKEEDENEVNDDEKEEEVKTKMETK
jgi:prolyl 4-hydroxylase